MGARIGSVALIVLLIGVAQYCQASREQQGAGLTSEASGSEKKLIDSQMNKLGGNRKSSVSTTTAASSKGESKDFDTDDTIDESEHIKFESLRESVQEGVLDGPAPSPSGAFSILPSLVTSTLALSLAILATKVV